MVNSKNREILSAIYARPIPKNLPWADIESLLIGVGCTVIEGAGSRVGFRFRGLRADFHRPHPGKEAKPYQIKAAREFLHAIGVIP